MTTVTATLIPTAVLSFSRRPERADAEEFAEDIVLREDGGEEDGDRPWMVPISTRLLLFTFLPRPACGFEQEALSGQAPQPPAPPLPSPESRFARRPGCRTRKKRRPAEDEDQTGSIKPDRIGNPNSELGPRKNSRMMPMAKQRRREPDAHAEPVDDGGQDAVLLRVHLGAAEDNAIDDDERQVDPERLVERRGKRPG